MLPAGNGVRNVMSGGGGSMKGEKSVAIARVPPEPSDSSRFRFHGFRIIQDQ